MKTDFACLEPHLLFWNLECFEIRSLNFKRLIKYLIKLIVLHNLDLQYKLKKKKEKRKKDLA